MQGGFGGVGVKIRGKRAQYTARVKYGTEREPACWVHKNRASVHHFLASQVGVGTFFPVFEFLREKKK